MDVVGLENCIGPLSNSYLARLPHHTVPCHNLHRVVGNQDHVEDVAELLEEPFPYWSTAPAPLIPLVPASRQVLNGYDPSKSLVKEKMKWQMKKDRLIQAARKDKKHISGRAIKRAVREPAGGNVVVPRGVALLAEHLDNDPDPYFGGAYNWYYTGGRLASLTHGDDQFLLHGNKSHLSYTKIANQDQADTCSVVPLSANDPVYQVISNSIGGVVVRQRMHLNVLSVSEDSDNQLELTNVKSIPATSHPFLSVAMPPNSIQQFCSVTNNGILKLWDLEYSRKQQKIRLRMEPGDGITVSDSWRTLVYVNTNTLLLADRCCVHVLDIRTGLQEKQLAWCPQYLTERCEELSYVMSSSSSRDQTVYLLTSHQAFTLDLRFGFSQRWTHMMVSPPLYGFTHAGHDEKEEVLCLGSVVSSDCVAMVNNWDGDEPHSRWRPGALPSPTLGLHLARLNGTCLHPSLQQRCNQNMTGLTCLADPAKGGLHVVRQSATSDVFTQHLTRHSNGSGFKQLTERGLAAYRDWCAPTLSWRGDQTSLSVPQVKDLSGLFKVLTSPSVPIKKVAAPVDTGSAWRLSKQYLTDCVDMLAGGMLAVWGVEDEEEWGGEVEEGVDEEEQDAGEKVLNWLGAAQQSTDFSLMRPTETSTPFPQAPILSLKSKFDKAKVDYLETSPDERQFPKTDISPARKEKPTPNMLSSSSSEGSPEPKRKKLEMFDESPAVKPAIKSLTTSAKKKFIPGF